MEAHKVPTHSFKLDNLFGVKDYVCLVTGGGSGIGLMMAQALAANGARVYITGRSWDKLQESAASHSKGASESGAIIPIGPCDVASKDGLDKLYKELSSKEDHLDLLVANAGISSTKADPEGESDVSKLKERLWAAETFEDWQECYKVDVAAVYFTTVAFLPMLGKAVAKKGAHKASVITTSSMSGMMRHAQGHFAYNAAKAATVHLTKLMSAEFKPTQIRVNSIAPGYFTSEMTAKESDENNKSHVPDSKISDKGHVPAERAGGDREMASAALFLATNSYVHGQILAVEGGVLDTVAS